MYIDVIAFMLMMTCTLYFSVLRSGRGGRGRGGVLGRRVQEWRGSRVV
jgi:hypothetical protein